MSNHANQGFNKSQAQRKGFECYYCRSPDHLKKDCPVLKEAKAPISFTQHHHYHHGIPGNASKTQQTRMP